MIPLGAGALHDRSGATTSVSAMDRFLMESLILAQDERWRRA
jgi:hypothetical protein